MRNERSAKVSVINGLARHPDATAKAAEGDAGDREQGGVREKHTAPEVALSWVDLPVTLKATLLGVLPLNSKVEAEPW